MRHWTLPDAEYDTERFGPKRTQGEYSYYHTIVSGHPLTIVYGVYGYDYPELVGYPAITHGHIDEFPELTLKPIPNSIDYGELTDILDICRTD